MAENPSQIWQKTNRSGKLSKLKTVQIKVNPCLEASLWSAESDRKEAIGKLLGPKTHFVQRKQWLSKGKMSHHRPGRKKKWNSFKVWKVKTCQQSLHAVEMSSRNEEALKTSQMKKTSKSLPSTPFREKGSDSARSLECEEDKRATKWQESS